MTKSQLDDTPKMLKPTEWGSERRDVCRLIRSKKCFDSISEHMERIERTRSSSPCVNDALAIAHKANTDAKKKGKKKSPLSYPLPPVNPSPLPDGK